MARLDTLGRLAFNVRPDDIDLSIHPRPAEVEILSFLNIHGAVNTNFLREWCSYKHPKNTQQALLRLWRGGYIFCPRQQRSADNNNACVRVYELDDRGRHYLDRRDILATERHRSNWWLHDYMVSCVSASIHIAARKAGYEFITRPYLLDRSGGQIWREVQGKKLIPDDLFALKSPDGFFRAFCVEADRSSEAGVTSKPNAKSYERAISQYAEFIGDNLYKEHFDLKARMFVLTVFNDKPSMRLYNRLIEEQLGECSYMLSQTVDNFQSDWQPPKETFDHLFTGEWQRVGHNPFNLNK